MRGKTDKQAGTHPRHRGTSGYASAPASQDRAHGLPQDKVHDFAAVSAERHADADLVHASAHTVRHHSIYADRSEQKRSEERRVGKGVDLGGRRIIKKKKKTEQAESEERRTM